MFVFSQWIIDVSFLTYYIKNRFQFSATKRIMQQCVHSENEFLFAGVQSHGISLIFFLFISAYTFYVVLGNCAYY